MDESKTVSFSVFRDKTDSLLTALTNLIERDFPSKLAGIPGLQEYLLVAMKVLKNTYEAICYLSADLPKDPSRKSEYGLATPPLVRCIADLLSTTVFIGEDLAKRTEWYHRGGWRELREDYERHSTEYGTLPEWQPFLKSYETALDEFAKRIGIAPSEAAAWGGIPYWPTPPQMLAKNSPITPPNRNFLQYVQDWLYRGLSQKAHVSAAGIVQAHISLLLKEEEGREQILQKMKPPRGKPRGIHRIQPSTLSTIGNLVVEAWST